jgi:hypothetical protein
VNALFAPPAVARAFRHTDAQRRDRAHAAALAIIEASASSAAVSLAAVRRGDHEAGVALMLRQRHRITATLYPGRNPAMWPIMGKPATECLADACRMIKATEAQRDAPGGPRWTFTVDPGRLRLLRHAEAALLAIVTGDEPDGQEAA